MVLGIDFDNTIISYDELIHQIAVEKKLIPASTKKNKKIIRDAIRFLPEGEAAWQNIQGIIYGQRVSEAIPLAGFSVFFEKALKKFSRIYIVSHKTEISPFDPTQSNLRHAALSWMEKEKIFSYPQFRRENVFFESTKEEKIARIATLKCSYFIDDLEEIFAHISFPTITKKILLNTEPPSAPMPGLQHMRSWDEIQNLLIP